MNNSTKEKKYFDNLINEGKNQINLGSYDNGISIFLKVVQLDPKNIRAMNNLGICYMKMVLFENAIQWYKKSLKLNPFDAMGWYERGLCHFNLSQFEWALACFKSATKHDSTNAEYWEKLGECYHILNQKSLALDCENEANKIKNDLENKFIDPDEEGKITKFDSLFLDSYENEIGVNVQNCIWHGLDCIDFNQFEEAIKNFEKGLESDPDISDFWLFKGICYTKMNSPIEAHECLIKVDWDVFFLHAFRLYRTGQFKKALRYFEKGIETNPSDPDLWDNKGLCLEQLGRSDEALKCYEHAKELDKIFIR
jgi:tetratricopeptide (TPR) repeat protein